MRRPGRLHGTYRLRTGPTVIARSCIRLMRFDSVKLQVGAKGYLHPTTSV
jgi:hypothetical protein